MVYPLKSAWMFQNKEDYLDLREQTPDLSYIEMKSSTKKGPKPSKSTQKN